MKKVLYAVGIGLVVATSLMLVGAPTWGSLLGYLVVSSNIINGGAK